MEDSEIVFSAFLDRNDAIDSVNTEDMMSAGPSVTILLLIIGNDAMSKLLDITVKFV